MKNLLVIHASPRGNRSHSRALGHYCVKELKNAHSDLKIVERDIGHFAPPAVDEEWIAAAYTPPEKRTAAQQAALKVSDELIAELMNADLILITTPMHNFSIPSTLKAYIDQVVRVGKTISSTYVPQLNNKKTLVITAKGDLYPENTPQKARDFVEPYLKLILGFIGLKNVTFINAEGLNHGDDAREKALKNAKDEIQKTVAQLTIEPVAPG
jgi:Acyl carrier protein phosphodiesterase